MGAKNSKRGSYNLEKSEKKEILKEMKTEKAISLTNMTEQQIYEDLFPFKRRSTKRKRKSNNEVQRPYSIHIMEDSNVPKRSSIREIDIRVSPKLERRETYSEPNLHNEESSNNYPLRSISQVDSKSVVNQNEGYVYSVEDFPEQYSIHRQFIEARNEPIVQFISGSSSDNGKPENKYLSVQEYGNPNQNNVVLQIRRASCPNITLEKEIIRSHSPFQHFRTIIQQNALDERYNVQMESSSASSGMSEVKFDINSTFQQQIVIPAAIDQNSSPGRLILAENIDPCCIYDSITSSEVLKPSEIQSINDWLAREQAECYIRERIKKQSQSLADEDFFTAGSESLPSFTGNKMNKVKFDENVTETLYINSSDSDKTERNIVSRKDLDSPSWSSSSSDESVRIVRTHININEKIKISSEDGYKSSEENTDDSEDEEYKRKMELLMTTNVISAESIEQLRSSYHAQLNKEINKANDLHVISETEEEDEQFYDAIDNERVRLSPIGKECEENVPAAVTIRRKLQLELERINGEINSENLEAKVRSSFDEFEALCKTEKLKFNTVDTWSETEKVLQNMDSRVRYPVLITDLDEGPVQNEIHPVTVSNLTEKMQEVVNESRGADNSNDTSKWQGNSPQYKYPDEKENSKKNIENESFIQLSREEVEQTFSEKETSDASIASALKKNSLSNGDLISWSSTDHVIENNDQYEKKSDNNTTKLKNEEDKLMENYKFLENLMSKSLSYDETDVPKNLIEVNQLTPSGKIEEHPENIYKKHITNAENEIHILDHPFSKITEQNNKHVSEIVEDNLVNYNNIDAGTKYEVHVKLFESENYASNESIPKYRVICSDSNGDDNQDVRYNLPSTLNDLEQPESKDDNKELQVDDASNVQNPFEATESDIKYQDNTSINNNLNIQHHIPLTLSDSEQSESKADIKELKIEDASFVHNSFENKETDVKNYNTNELFNVTPPIPKPRRSQLKSKSEDKNEYTNDQKIEEVKVIPRKRSKIPKQNVFTFPPVEVSTDTIVKENLSNNEKTATINWKYVTEFLDKERIFMEAELSSKCKIFQTLYENEAKITDNNINNKDKKDTSEDFLTAVSPSESLFCQPSSSLTNKLGELASWYKDLESIEPKNDSKNFSESEKSFRPESEPTTPISASSDCWLPQEIAFMKAENETNHEREPVKSYNDNFTEKVSENELMFPVHFILRPNYIIEEVTEEEDTSIDCEDRIPSKFSHNETNSLKTCHQTDKHDDNNVDTNLIECDKLFENILETPDKIIEDKIDSYSTTLSNSENASKIENENICLNNINNSETDKYQNSKSTFQNLKKNQIMITESPNETSEYEKMPKQPNGSVLTGFFSKDARSQVFPVQVLSISNKDEDKVLHYEVSNESLQVLSSKNLFDMESLKIYPVDIKPCEHSSENIEYCSENLLNTHIEDDFKTKSSPETQLDGFVESSVFEEDLTQYLLQSDVTPKEYQKDNQFENEHLLQSSHANDQTGKLTNEEPLVQEIVDKNCLPTSSFEELRKDCENNHAKYSLKEPIAKVDEPKVNLEQEREKSDDFLNSSNTDQYTALVSISNRSDSMSVNSCTSSNNGKENCPQQLENSLLPYEIQETQLTQTHTSLPLEFNAIFESDMNKNSNTSEQVKQNKTSLADVEELKPNTLEFLTSPHKKYINLNTESSVQVNNTTKGYQNNPFLPFDEDHRSENMESNVVSSESVEINWAENAPISKNQDEKILAENVSYSSGEELADEDNQNDPNVTYRNNGRYQATRCKSTSDLSLKPRNENINGSNRLSDPYLQNLFTKIIPREKKLHNGNTVLSRSRTEKPKLLLENENIEQNEVADRKIMLRKVHRGHMVLHGTKQNESQSGKITSNNDNNSFLGDELKEELILKESLAELELVKETIGNLNEFDETVRAEIYTKLLAIRENIYKVRNPNFNWDIMSLKLEALKKTRMLLKEIEQIPINS